MNIVFISNYFNHHQSELCEEIYKKNEMFYFIETTEMRKERKKMGYEIEVKPRYVLKLDRQMSLCSKIISNANIIILGSVKLSLVKKMMKKDAIIFRYTERPLKRGNNLKMYLPRLLKWQYELLSSPKTYLLCASAYTSYDYNKFFLFRNKAFKWGYFPKAKHYENVSCLIDNKQHNSILWCGRMIDWKHPEVPLIIAKKLKQDGYQFKLSLIGDGEEFKNIKELVSCWRLEKEVELLGVKNTQEVRVYMEQSEIYLCTSDYREGWGVVVNEAMNSGCAVVVSHAVGSAPFLIKNYENGIIYENENIDMLYDAVKKLFADKTFRMNISCNAYYTIINEWNAEVAAKRFIQLADSLLNQSTQKFEVYDGPCSRAMVLKDKWSKERYE